MSTSERELPAWVQAGSQKKGCPPASPTSLREGSDAYKGLVETLAQRGFVEYRCACGGEATAGCSLCNEPICRSCTVDAFGHGPICEPCYHPGWF